MADEIPKIVPLAEAARALNQKPSWFYNKISRGVLPFPVVRIGRSLNFRVSDLARYIEENTSDGTAKRA